jgi:hypothetical protein
MFPIHIAGVPVTHRAVLELAALVADEKLAARLRGAVEAGARVLAVDDAERDEMLVALVEPPDGLAELRGTLLRERAA